MLPIRKEHSKECGGRVFGCGCAKQNNNLPVTGQDNRAFTGAGEEATEDAGKAGGDYLDNIVIARDCTNTVHNIHNQLKKTVNIDNNSQNLPSTPLSPCPSDLVMLLTPHRSKKRILLVCLLVLLVFVLATSLPFLVSHLRPAAQPVTFLPLQNVYHQIYGEETRHLQAGHNKRQPVFPHNNHRENQRFLSNNSILNQIYISIKTTQKYHYPRLVILLETWVSLVKEQTWIFTDSSNNTTDSDLVGRTGDHLILTNCSSSHHRLSLCCKMEQEFEHFLRSHKQWWCHFDDDNYVNVVALAKLLERYESDKPWYLGKTSTASALKIMDINGKTNSSFWFATGGAGFCVSRTLAMKMAPYAVDGKFVEAGNQFWFPDDVTLGFIIEHKLGIPLTVVQEFHSHLEPMALLTKEELHTHISFSYLIEGTKSNIVPITGPFPPSIDPTRFYSLHCSLHSAELCPDQPVH